MARADILLIPQVKNASEGEFIKYFIHYVGLQAASVVTTSMWCTLQLCNKTIYEIRLAITILRGMKVHPEIKETILQEGGLALCPTGFLNCLPEFQETGA